MNVGSLFSGIGGMDAGLARAGHDHAFFCEADPWRREVLAARWPGIPVYDDVRAVGEPARGASPDGGSASVDGGREAGTGLLCGGFPCQDLSVAGKRRGLAGERSGLFFEFARIIDAFRPRWILIENVPGLLSSNGGRDFGVVLGTLADLGYGVGWRVLDSRFFGVPQRRRRVFIVGAVADGDPSAAAGRAGQVLAVGSRCPGHPPAGSKTGEDAASASTVSTLASSGKSGGWRVGADEAAGGQLVAHTLRAEGFDASEDGTGRGTMFTSSSWRRPGAFTPSPVAPLVAAPLTKGASAGVRRLTPIECERLQGLPDGWTDLGGTPDSRRYSALGDAVTANVAEWIGLRLAEAS